jgi:hypothetical protein
VKLVELTEIEDSGLLAETIARFRREAATLARLRHPNIIAALEAGRISNELFLVMELAEGISLASMLEQRAENNLGLFPVLSVLRVMEQACAALSAAHAAGVVHRDIKPSNLMVATRLHVKLIDFGIARLLHDNSPRLTLPSQAIGTLAYISPEQLSGIDVDGRADLYSLGCVLYELLAGRPPFMAEVPTALLRMQLQERAVPLAAIRADLPPELSQLVEQMMEKDRTRRPSGADEVLARLADIRAGLDGTRVEHEADRETINRATSLGTGPAAGAGAAGAAASATGARGPSVRPSQRLSAEADRHTVLAQPGGAPPQATPGPEGDRSTRLTPDRLGELSGPGTMHRGTMPAFPDGPSPQYSPGGAGVGGAGAGAAGLGGPPTTAPGSYSQDTSGWGPQQGAPSTQHPDTRQATPYPETQHPGTQRAGNAGGPAWPDAAKARPRRRRSRWVPILSTLLTVAIVAGVAIYVFERNHQSLKVTAASVAVTPPGKACNVTVDVVGTIVTNGKGGPVTYQWYQNSIPQTATTATDASGQDTVQVTLHWVFHGKGTQQATAELHVLSPNTAVANTQFTYSCA